MRGRGMTLKQPLLKKALLKATAIAVSLFAGAVPASADALDNAEQNADTPTIRFCYQDIDLYPNYTGAGSEKPDMMPGAIIELYELTVAASGAKVEFFRYSWNRCVALLTAGRVDSVVASYIPDRESFAVFPMQDGQPDRNKRLTTSAYHLYHMDKDREFWDGSSFSDPNITVAASLGYSVVRHLRNQGINVVEAGNTASLLQLLLYGRIDAIAVPDTTADTLIRREVTRYSEVKKDPMPLKESPYFIVFSHTFAANHKALVERVWSNSENVRTDYRSQILEKY